MLAASDLATRAGDEAGIGHGLKVMGRYLAKRNTGTREMLGREYTCAFLGVQEAEGKVALPSRVHSQAIISDTWVRRAARFTTFTSGAL